MKSDALHELKALADAKKASFFPKFFKAGKGEYAEGDVFLGVSVPDIRNIAKKYRDLPFSEIKKLLANDYHEARLLALIILTMQYARADDAQKQKIVDFYLTQFSRVNNWDLVDSSASQILGSYLLTHPRGMLMRFAKSPHLWTQRIAIVSTYAFIRADQFEETLNIAEIFLSHKHDLIHKATGWMLREVGKRDMTVLRKFLDRHAAEMPRTMLRYAIEKMTSGERRQYMNAGKA